MLDARALPVNGQWPAVVPLPPAACQIAGITARGHESRQVGSFSPRPRLDFVRLSWPGTNVCQLRESTHRA
jgi:hypothetical protein